jgi:hypothetical protein
MIRCDKKDLEWLVMMQDHDDFLNGFSLKLQSDHLQLRYELTLISELNPVRTQCSHEYVDKILSEKCKNIKHNTDHTVSDLKNALYKSGKVDQYTRALLCNLDKTTLQIYDVSKENTLKQKQVKKLIKDYNNKYEQ